MASLETVSATGLATLSGAPLPDDVNLRGDVPLVDPVEGREPLIRGNHDYWCPRSVNRLRPHLPPSLTLLGADACDLGAAVVCGTRGWMTPETPGYAPATDAPIYQRELGMLDRALAHANQL